MKINDFVFNLPKLVGVVHSLDTFSMFFYFLYIVSDSPEQNSRKIIQKKKKIKWTQKLYFLNRLFGSVTTFSFAKHNQIIINFKTNIRIFCIDIILLFFFVVFAESSISSCVDWCEPFSLNLNRLTSVEKNYNTINFDHWFHLKQKLEEKNFKGTKMNFDH